ncbi:unnamed protein product [Lampetra planeri]
METEWRRSIARQLRQRDRGSRDAFGELIQRYTRLLEKADLQSLLSERLQKETHDGQGHAETSSSHDGASQGAEISALRMKHQEELTTLHKIRGELAQDVIELNHKLSAKEQQLQEMQTRLAESEVRAGGLQAEVDRLRAELAELQAATQTVKDEYEALQMACTALESRLRRVEEDNRELVARWMAEKAIEADRVNTENEKDTRRRQEKLRKELAEAAQEHVNVDLDDDIEVLAEEATEGAAAAGYIRDICASLCTHIEQTFVCVLMCVCMHLCVCSKRRASSVVSAGEGQVAPSSVCLAARLPERAICKFDAHDGEVNATRFSPNSRLLVTGGTDRKVKLWDVIAGKTECRGTLSGSNAGITSLDFDNTGTYLLASSSDFASRIWTVDDFRLRHTLTGHSGKVLSAKFMSDFVKIVSGSHDRTLKLWDLRSRACIRTIFAGSSCNDVVCSEQCVISGHYDKKIRFWDTRSESVRTELELLGRVTSLDLNAERTELLSCSRDDSLRITELRTNSTRISLTAEGFKCGADWTRAVFSPDGQYVTAGSADGTLFVWNAATGHVERSLSRHHSAAVNAVAWSPSGEYILSVDKAKRAVLWRRQGQESLRRTALTGSSRFTWAKGTLWITWITWTLWTALFWWSPITLRREKERLLRKLGENAHPFVFHIPQDLPCSVTLQPGPEDTGKACGVDYEVKAFCANSPDEKPHHRNSVSLGIRKVQFAPLRSGPQPVAETRRQFLLSDKALHLEASLDKQIYYHGEPISVNVRVTNSSSRSVKRIKVSVRQCADICLFSTAQYRCPVAAEEAEETVGPGATLCREFRLTPLLDNNRDKRGLALDGQLRHGDTNLASSSIVKEGVSKELLGIVVSYRVKVKVVVARGGDALVELPFTLMHPKPKEEEGRGKKIPAPPGETRFPILGSVYGADDDFVFEDFARQRLVGNTEDGYTC